MQLKARKNKTSYDYITFVGGWVKPGGEWIKPGDWELGDHVIHNKCLRQFTFCYRCSNFEMEITILITLTMLIIRGEANSELVITKIKGGWVGAVS